MAGDTAGEKYWPDRLFKRSGLGWCKWFGRWRANGCAYTDGCKTTQCSGGPPEIPSLEHGLKVYRSASNVLCFCLPPKGYSKDYIKEIGGCINRRWTSIREVLQFVDLHGVCFPIKILKTYTPNCER